MDRDLLFLPLVIALVACGATRTTSATDGGGVVTADAGDICTGIPPSDCARSCACSPQCVGGAWVCACSFNFCPPDAGDDSGIDGGEDAGPVGDASLACGPVTCDSSKEYCFTAGGGPPPLDGGSNQTWTCTPLPADCHGAATCACIEADGGANGCPCTTDDAGAVTVECLYP